MLSAVTSSYCRGKRVAMLFGHQRGAIRAAAFGERKTMSLYAFTPWSSPLINAQNGQSYSLDSWLNTSGG